MSGNRDSKVQESSVSPLQIVTPNIKSVSYALSTSETSNNGTKTPSNISKQHVGYELRRSLFTPDQDGSSSPANSPEDSQSPTMQHQATMYPLKDIGNSFENVLVAVRFRPDISPTEHNALQVWKLGGNNVIEERSLDYSTLNDRQMQLVALADDRRGSYQFDKVFGTTTGNFEVYTDFAQHIVNRCLQGYNSTLFAYGQTTAGKTHTILGDESEAGVLVMALQQIFQHVESMQDDKYYIVRISYLEIYQTELIDLLREPELSDKFDEHGEPIPIKGPKLTIADHPVLGPIVRGAQVPIVDSVETAMRYLAQGEARRHTGETAMNDSSSRSHTILQVRIENCDKSGEEPKIPIENPDGSHLLLNQQNPESTVSVATLNIIDLAGSERVSKSKARGTRLQEAGYINKSLSTLGNVIASINAGHKYIPFRDSKLTRLLSSALGGNSCTGAICCVSPNIHHRNETRSTLQFAQRISQITNFATLNQVQGAQRSTVETDALIQGFTNEIQALKQQLLLAQSGQESQYEIKMQVKDLQGKLAWLQSKHFASTRRAPRSQQLGFRTPGWKRKSSFTPLYPATSPDKTTTPVREDQNVYLSPQVKSAMAVIHRIRTRSAHKPPLSSTQLGSSSRKQRFVQSLSRRAHQRSPSGDTQIDEPWESDFAPLNLATVVDTDELLQSPSPSNVEFNQTKQAGEHQDQSSQAAEYQDQSMQAVAHQNQSMQNSNVNTPQDKPAHINHNKLHGDDGACSTGCLSLTRPPCLIHNVNCTCEIDQCTLILKQRLLRELESVTCSRRIQDVKIPKGKVFQQDRTNNIFTRQIMQERLERQSNHVNQLRKANEQLRNTLGILVSKYSLLVSPQEDDELDTSTISEQDELVVHTHKLRSIRKDLTQLLNM